MSHGFFDRSSSKSFIRNPLKSRNNPQAGGKVQVCFLRPLMRFSKDTAATGGFDYFAPSNIGGIPLVKNCQPFRTFRYEERFDLRAPDGIPRYYESKSTIARRSALLTVSETMDDYAFANNLGNQGGWFGNGGAAFVTQILENSAQRTVFVYRYIGFPNEDYGIVTLEYLDPYTQAEIMEDLGTLMTSLDIDAQPFPGSGQLAVYDRCYDRDGQPQDYADVVNYELTHPATELVSQTQTGGSVVVTMNNGSTPLVSTVITTTVKKTPLGHTLLPDTIGLPQCYIFEQIVGCSGNFRLPANTTDHPPTNVYYPRYSAQLSSNSFNMGFFVGGFSNYIDRKFQRPGGSQVEFNLDYGWQPTLARSRWRLGIPNPIVLQANYLNDPRITGCLPTTRIGLNGPTNDIPFPDDLEWFGPPTWNQFDTSSTGGELRINYWPDGRRNIFLPIFASTARPKWLATLPGYGFIGAEVPQENFQLPP